MLVLKIENLNFLKNNEYFNDNRSQAYNMYKSKMVFGNLRIAQQKDILGTIYDFSSMYRSAETGFNRIDTTKTK